MSTYDLDHWPGEDELSRTRPVPHRVYLTDSGMDGWLDVQVAEWESDLAREGLERVGERVTFQALEDRDRMETVVKMTMRVRRVPSPYDWQETGPIIHLNREEPVCPGTVCQYAMDVGVPEHGVDPSRRGGCGNCGHYQAPMVWEGDQA